MDEGCSGGVLCPGVHKCLRRWGSKPSYLTSSPFYRFNLCQLKLVYCLKTQFKRVGGGGGGGAGGAELNIHKSKINYQAAKLLSFLNLQMLKMFYFSFVIVRGFKISWKP